MANGKRIGDLLVELEFITKGQLKEALKHQRESAPQKKVGELLVELGFLNEEDLLKCLAGLFKVRYLSSDKLAHMTIPQWILDLIPLDFAEEHNILPFFCYDKTKIMSVAVPEPQDKQLPKLIRNVSGYNEVELYLALGSAIQAAIARHYRNDLTAFSRLKGLAKPDRAPGLHRRVSSGVQAAGMQGSVLAEAAFKREDAAREMPFEAHPSSTDLAPPRKEGRRRLSDHIFSVSPLVEDTLVELLNVLVNVLELYKGEMYKGHSASVAKMVREMGRSMGVEAKEIYYHVLGAYLHDCCMNSPEHLTLLHFNTDDSNDLAKKYSKYSERLFENTGLPHDVLNIILHTLERFDGQGYPYGLRGKGIPLGSRIIAVVDALMHLVKFDQNVDSKNLFKDAFETIKSHANIYFDPEVVEALAEVIVDHLIDENSPRIIIIGDESEELDALARRLKKSGVFPYVLDDTDKATNVLWAGPISLIISEINTQPMDGISFCNYVKSNEEYKNISFMFLSKENVADTISKGFAVGADDFVTKPYNPDIVIPKIHNLIKLKAQKTEKEAESFAGKKGITGNLAEVEVTDLIQMLSRGRQTGALKLFRDEEEGEIFFADGQVINARYNEWEKEEAFNLLIRWDYGLFRLDHEAALPEKKIRGGTDMLLIDACRIWDEEKQHQTPS